MSFLENKKDKKEVKFLVKSEESIKNKLIEQISELKTKNILLEDKVKFLILICYQILIYNYIIK